MRWPFGTTEREGRHREEDEHYRKSEEATRRLADLFIRHYSMATSDIIGELEQIHRYYRVPGGEASGKGGGYFGQLAKELSQSSLTSEEASRLVAMLSWPELRAYEDRSAPTSFVTAAMQNPSETYIPVLSEHVAWLEKEIKPLGSSQYRTDIASEIRLTKAAIQACRLGS